MGVTLERVQNKFACIIGELCSEPDILSQFAVWVDLRIAEYKAKGAISLDCTGLTPDPKWLKGLKTVSSQADSPLQKGPARLSSGNARHKNQVSSSAQNSSFETTVNPEWSSESHDTESVVVKQEMDHDSAAFPISLHSNHSNSTITVPRKRQGGDDGDISHSDNSIFSSSHPSKSKRLSPHSDNSLSGGGQDSVSNQSFLSVIGVNDQPDQTPQDTLLPVRENSADLAESSEDITITYNDSQVFYHQPATTDPAQTEWDRSRFITNHKERGRNPTSDTSLIIELDAPEPGRSMEASATVPRQLGHPDSRYSTLKNTRYAVATFERWLVTHHGDNTKMEKIDPVKLDAYLVEFFLTAKRSTGEDYRAGSIRLLRERFERHLKLYGYPHSLVYSELFAKSQQAFKERKRQLKDLELSGGLSGNK
ncbi:uncharacterized protein LOC135463764 isoform X1 [Liolophura sinensis]|uniref:uncharacterized protein LOC135463764 isoform X1 n=1 Tax=Liolophura sinensis TaxID=3198878 RepID=UPI0031585DDA